MVWLSVSIAAPLPQQLDSLVCKILLLVPQEPSPLPLPRLLWIHIVSPAPLEISIFPASSKWTPMKNGPTISDKDGQSSLLQSLLPLSLPLSSLFWSDYVQDPSSGSSSSWVSLACWQSALSSSCKPKESLQLTSLVNNYLNSAMILSLLLAAVSLEPQFCLLFSLFVSGQGSVLGLRLLNLDLCS